MSTEDLKNLLRSSLIGAVVAGLLILSSYAQVVTPAQDFLEKIVIPVQVSVVNIDQKIGSFFSSITGVGNVRSENRTLRDEIVRLQAENSEITTLREENEYLRSQISVVSQLDMEYVLADVIAFDRDLVGIGRLKLGVGEVDNVEVGRVVMSGPGILLGRVVEVGKYTCMVEIITDPADKIPVKLKGTNVRGLLIGESEQGLIVENINRDVDIELGSIMATSGEDGNYPAGLLVGVVKSEEEDPASAFKALVLEPLFTLSEVTYVLVEAE